MRTLLVRSVDCSSKFLILPNFVSIQCSPLPIFPKFCMRLDNVVCSTPIIYYPAVGCHYFPPDLRLPSQPKSVTARRPVPNYTACWQRHIRVSSLPKAVTRKRTGRDSNPRPFGSRANALPLSHTVHWLIETSGPNYPQTTPFSIFCVVNILAKQHHYCTGNQTGKKYENIST